MLQLIAEVIHPCGEISGICIQRSENLFDFHVTHYKLDRVVCMASLRCRVGLLPDVISTACIASTLLYDVLATPQLLLTF
jgi:hypothetical protein